MFARITLATALLVGSLSSTALADKLGAGDPAPALAVGKWVKGDPVASFEKGKVYVVEFWATWCKPCRESIPHLSELQKTWRDKGVTIIGVSVREDDQSAVAPFVEKMGDKMAYRVAQDDVPEDTKGDDGKMAKTWLDAAGQGGIPTAFIVDGQSRIAWVGHPTLMDKPLEQIVAGKWDIEAVKRKEAIELRLKAAQRSGDGKAAVAAIDELLALDPKLELMHGATKFILLVQGKNYEQAYAYGAKLVDGTMKDAPDQLNAIAWTIVDPEAKGMEKRDLPLALRAATRANELTGSKRPDILDTLAKVHFDQGDVAKAIEFQQRAADFAKGMPILPEIQQRLEEYKAANKGRG